MKLLVSLPLLSILALSLSSCSLHKLKTPTEKRQHILNMKNNALNVLYRTKPHARRVIRKAVGYAVFKNANVNVIIASFAGGYGVAIDNRNGRKTYMRMGEIGIGLGIGVKDYRVIFAFHTRAAYRRFVRYGWNAGAHIDAAAKARHKGKSIAGEAQIGHMTIYSITKSGLALQATIKGTKFWRDKDLNK